MPSPNLRAGVLDAACILAFAAVGRASHSETETVAGVLGTAWPFLAGCALGWLTLRLWRFPPRAVPQGVCVWGMTWAFGLLLRSADGGGTAPSFVVVAAVVLGALLVGWRAVAMAISALLARRATRPPVAARPAPPR